MQILPNDTYLANLFQYQSKVTRQLIFFGSGYESTFQNRENLQRKKLNKEKRIENERNKISIAHFAIHGRIIRKVRRIYFISQDNILVTHVIFSLVENKWKTDKKIIENRISTEFI